MTYQAGSASVSITPDMTRFHRDIAADLKADPPQATVKTSADTTAARTQLDALTRTRTAKVKVEIDKKALKSLALPALAVGGVSALGPSALGLAAGVAGLGVAAGSAVGGLAAFAAIAKGPVTEALKANQDAAKGNLTALQALSPAERQLATDLGGVTSAWSALQKAEAPVVASALAPWLETAVSGMQLLSPLIEDTAGAVQLLGTEAQKALAAPFWGTFVNTVGTTAQISLVNFGEAAGKVGDGLAHLFTTFAPDIDKLPPLVNKAADAFDKWARSVTAGGLEDFFAKTFSPANVAALKTDLGNVATIVQNIATAGAQLSPTAFAGLSNLLTVLAKLSPGQIEALAVVYGISKTVGGAGNLAKLATGGAVLSLPGKKGAKKTAAKTGAPAEEEVPAKAGKLAKAGKVAGAAVKVVPAVAAVSALDQAIPKGPGGEWVNSWAPYEKIFTNDLPTAWSVSYEAFQSNFAGPMTNWFTQSLPHFFTNVIPSDIWSPAYEGFEQYIGSPVANFFTSTLPGLFSGAGSWLTSAGQSVASGFVAGWNATSGAVSAAFGAAKTWVSGVFTGAVSWLTSAGNDVASGFVRAWNATQGAVTGAFGAAKNWVSGVFSGTVSWLTGAGNDVAAGLVRAWNATEGAVTGAFAAAKNWVSAQFTGAASWLSAAGNAVATGLVRAWDATEGAVTGAFSRVKGWVTSVFSDAGSWLKSAGTAAVNGFVNVIKSNPGIIENALLGLVPSSLRNAVSSVLGKVGFASGTPSAPPGWAWVGERGPELVKFRGGEQVKTAGASLSMAAQAQSMSALSSLGVPSAASAPRLPGVGTAVRSAPLQLQLSYAGTGSQLTDALVGALQVHIQGQAGGDVQAALGRGPVRIQ